MVYFVGFVVVISYDIRCKKTLSKKVVWEFLKEKGLDVVVVVNPGTIVGPVISLVLNASVVMLVHLLQG